MKANIEALAKKYERSMQAEGGMEKEIKEAATKLDELKAAEAAAAEAGDVAAYTRAKAARQAAEDALFVKNAQFEKLKAGRRVTLDEAKRTWTDYVAEYNRELSTKEKAFNKALETAAKIYAEMLDLQNEALYTRERCSFFAGMDLREARSIVTAELGRKLDKDFPMDYIDQATCKPAGLLAATLQQMGLLDESKARILNEVVNLHRSSK